MKANELMIGDWVYNKHHGKNIKLTPYDFFTHTHNEFGEQELAPFAKPTIGRDLEPIPLTQKILEKNGFENIGDDTYQLEEKPCWFWVDFFRHTYGCEYDTSTYEYEDDEHRLKLYGIPSVHELQHALRICGIEKEIEL